MVVKLVVKRRRRRRRGLVKHVLITMLPSCTKLAERRMKVARRDCKVLFARMRGSLCVRAYICIPYVRIVCIISTLLP